MKSAYVYLQYCPDLELYKIGVSVNYKQRIKSLQTGNPFEIITKETFYSKYPYKVESALHREFNCQRQSLNEIKLKGEWFLLSAEQVNNFLLKCESIEKNIEYLVNAGNIFILRNY